MTIIHRSHRIERVPPNVVRQLIEIVPDKVLRPPTIQIKGHTLCSSQTSQLTQAARNAWCYARQFGYAHLYTRDDGTISVQNHNLVDRKSKEVDSPTYIFTNQDSYYDFSSPQSRHGSSVVTEEVTRAYCLYRDIAERLYLRAKNGSQSLVTLFKGEDDDDVVDKEVMELLDSQFDRQNRIYAQEGSKLQGTSVSLDGIADTLKAFWVNIFRVAGVPLWILDVDEINSQYPLDYRETELTRMWEQFALPCYHALLAEWIDPTDFGVFPPNYRSVKSCLEEELIRADIRNRDAASEYNEAKARLTAEQTSQLQKLVL